MNFLNPKNHLSDSSSYSKLPSAPPAENLKSDDNVPRAFPVVEGKILPQIQKKYIKAIHRKGEPGINDLIEYTDNKNEKLSFSNLTNLVKVRIIESDNTNLEEQENIAKVYENAINNLRLHKDSIAEKFISIITFGFFSKERAIDEGEKYLNVFDEKINKYKNALKSHENYLKAENQRKLKLREKTDEILPIFYDSFLKITSEVNLTLNEIENKINNKFEENCEEIKKGQPINFSNLNFLDIGFTEKINKEKEKLDILANECKKIYADNFNPLVAPIIDLKIENTTCNSYDLEKFLLKKIANIETKILDIQRSLCNKTISFISDAYTHPGNDNLYRMAKKWASYTSNVYNSMPLNNYWIELNLLSFDEWEKFRNRVGKFDPYKEDNLPKMLSTNLDKSASLLYLSKLNGLKGKISES